MNKSNKLIIIMVIVIIGLVAYIIYNNYIKKDDDTEVYDGYTGLIDVEYEARTYAINEYAKLSIDDNQMAIIYFSDYQQYLTNNVNKAYELVDPTYANIKFTDISQFKSYVADKYKNAQVKKYNVIRKNDYDYYIVYDTNNDAIVFKTDGVMNYTVYLDNETVVIQ